MFEIISLKTYNYIFVVVCSMSIIVRSKREKLLVI